jgi:four helix bundle protein
LRDHKYLRAYELADECAILIYQMTKDFPSAEIYGLAAQMRKAVVSVASNIVEGCTRESKIEYQRFIEIAFGLLKEMNYQFSLAKRLGYIRRNDISIYEQKLV